MGKTKVSFEKHFSLAEGAKGVLGVSVFPDCGKGSKEYEEQLEKYKAILGLLNINGKLREYEIFIACQIAYLKLKESEGTALEKSRKAGDELEKEYLKIISSFSDKIKGKVKISRWIEFDNQEETGEQSEDYKNNNAHYKKALGFSLFCAICGFLNAGFEQIERLINVKRGKDSGDLDSEINALLSQSKSADKITLETIKNLLDTLDDIEKQVPENVVNWCKELSFEENFQERSETLASSIIQIAEERHQNHAEEKLNATKYAIYDVAGIITIAWCKQPDYLFYPLNKKEPYLGFFQAIRNLLDFLDINMEIVDLLVRNKRATATAESKAEGAGAQENPAETTGKQTTQPASKPTESAKNHASVKIVKFPLKDSTNTIATAPNHEGNSLETTGAQTTQTATRLSEKAGNSATDKTTSIVQLLNYSILNGPIGTILENGEHSPKNPSLLFKTFKGATETLQGLLQLLITDPEDHEKAIAQLFAILVAACRNHQSTAKTLRM